MSSNYFVFNKFFVPICIYSVYYDTVMYSFLVSSTYVLCFIIVFMYSTYIYIKLSNVFDKFIRMNVIRERVLS
jgi:hypothetical protein